MIPRQIPLPFNPPPPDIYRALMALGRGNKALAQRAVAYDTRAFGRAFPLPFNDRLNCEERAAHPLGWALVENRWDLIDPLLELGASPNAPDPQTGQTPVGYLVEFKLCLPSLTPQALPALFSLLKAGGSLQSLRAKTSETVFSYCLTFEHLNGLWDTPEGERLWEHAKQDAWSDEACWWAWRAVAFRQGAPWVARLEAAGLSALAWDQKQAYSLPTRVAPMSRCERQRAFEAFAKQSLPWRVPPDETIAGQDEYAKVRAQVLEERFAIVAPSRGPRL